MKYKKLPSGDHQLFEIDGDRFAMTWSTEGLPRGAAGSRKAETAAKSGTSGTVAVR